VLVLARVVIAEADGEAVDVVVAFKDLEAVDTMEEDASTFVDDGVTVEAVDKEPPTSEAEGDKLDRRDAEGTPEGEPVKLELTVFVAAFVMADGDAEDDELGLADAERQAVDETELV
jgi:hypothetical protein